MAVDREFRDKWNKAVNTAGRNGFDLVETLERNGLLATPEWTHAIQVQALEDLHRRFEKRSPSELMQFFLGKSDGTPEDMFRAVSEWQEALIRNIAEKKVPQ